MSSAISSPTEKGVTTTNGHNYQAQIMDTLQLRANFIQRNQLQTSEDVDHLLSLSEKIYDSIVDDEQLKTLVTNERFYDHIFSVLSKLPDVVRNNSDADDHHTTNALKLFKSLLLLLKKLVVSSNQYAESDGIEKAKKFLLKASYIDVLLKLLQDFHCGKNLQLRSQKSVREIFKILCESTAKSNADRDFAVKQLTSTKEPVIMIQKLIVDYCLEGDGRCASWESTLLANLCTAISRESPGIQEGIVNRLPEFRDQFLLPILAKSSCCATIFWTLRVLGNLQKVRPPGISDTRLAAVLCLDKYSNFIESLLSNVLEARQFEKLTKPNSSERKELSRICMHIFLFLSRVDEFYVVNRRLAAQKFKYLKIFADFSEHIREYRDVHDRYSQILELLISVPDPRGRSDDELLSVSFVTSRTRAFLASESEFCEKFAKKPDQDETSNVHKHRAAMKVLKLNKSSSEEGENEKAEEEEEGCLERETEIVNSLFG